MFLQTREIVVPPESRVVNVEVLPSRMGYKTGYNPRKNAKAKLPLTDENGEPVVGSAVVSIYDKSVAYVTGG